MGAVAQIRFVPSNCTTSNCCQRWDSNCPPQSVVMTEGAPNRATQPVTNALATISAMIYAIGIASGQHVKWSTHVSQYVKPFEGGNGLTISRWTWSNWASGVAKVANGVTVCYCIFNLWRCRHVRAHFLMSEFMLGHTNCAVTSVRTCLYITIYYIGLTMQRETAQLARNSTISEK